MKDANLIALLVGIIAVIFFVVSIQFKKRKLLLFQIIANLLYGVQYFILGVFNASLLNVISTIRSIVFYYYDIKSKKPSIIILLMFIFLLIIVSYIMAEDFFSYLVMVPLIITIFYAISTWSNNIKFIRYTFLIASVFWFFYNYNVGAYASLIGNILEFISGIVSITRLKKR